MRSKPLHELTEKQDGKKKPDGKKKMADIGWRNATLGFVSDRHHICVGITRCKYGMVIVGKFPCVIYWKGLLIAIYKISEVMLVAVSSQC